MYIDVFMLKLNGQTPSTGSGASKATADTGARNRVTGAKAGKAD
jgi:hypothetical protein